MARRSKKNQPRIISPRGQARNAIGPRLRIGESRHAAKAEGKDKGLIYSLGTKRVAIERLTQAAKWLQERGKTLTDLTPELAKEYLDERRLSYAIKTLKSDVQQIKNHFAFQGKKLDYKVHVPRLTNCRTYTPEQVKLIMEAQSSRNAISTELAYRCDLRAHELHTLRQASERPADNRRWTADRFAGREGITYTVEGKGGLVREVLLPHDLAQRLEQHRLDQPQTVRDRQISYEKHYDIGGGQAWSQSFSEASKKALGWSRGAHGLRHAYAQERVEELQRSGRSFEQALETVSQELGHFRSDITLTYLR
jgi:integrase